MRICTSKKVSNLWLTIFLCAIFLIPLIATGGCGKKGDPRPPLITLPEPPVQLRYSLDSDKGRAILRWSHPDLITRQKPDAGKENSEIRRFELFRATLRLSADACKGCPLDFEKIATLPFPISEYVDPIERGFTYFYRVSFYSDRNSSSPFSETVEVKFQ